MSHYKYEIIAVNDGSTDGTRQKLLEAKKNISNLKIINSKEHIGKWAAITEAFGKSKGEIIITSDSDLQDFPKEFSKLIKKLNSGYDLVSGNRYKRRDSYYKILLSKIGSSFFNFQDINSPFKAYRREVFEHVPKEGSLIRFSPFFALKMGYRVSEIKIISRPRLYGRSKFGVVKYLRIIFDAILIKLLFTGSGRISSL